MKDWKGVARETQKRGRRYGDEGRIYDTMRIMVLTNMTKVQIRVVVEFVHRLEVDVSAMRFVHYL